MTLKSLLDFTLIQTNNYSLKVFHILEVALIFVITYAVIWITKRVFRKQEKKRNLEVGQWHAVFQIIKYILWVAAFLISIDSIGVKITFLLASSAALLVGLGLGLQAIFQDFVAGIALLFEGSIKIGDVVEIENDIVGQIREISLRTTKMETRDNIIMIIPNSKFISDIVINWSHREKNTRFNVKVGVAYGSDVEKVTKILLECAGEHKKISAAPAPFVRFENFGDSSLDFELYFWSTETFRVENIKSDVRYKINDEFKKNGVQIPFPQRDVHIRSK